jgi:very-short-patch-repair endonuclease
LAATYRHDAGLPELIDSCRELRQESTDAEAALWRRLRGRQLAGAKFRRQHQVGRFIVDFFCAEAHLAVEADGGHHYAEQQAAHDAERTAALAEVGVRVLRFSNRDVLQGTDSVLEAIAQALKEPSPQPSPEGRGSR